MLADDTRTVDVLLEAGVVKRENWDTGQIEAAPNGSFTFTIKINGGASVTRESAVAKMLAETIERHRAEEPEG